MSASNNQNKTFLIQGSILAIAGVVTKIIGAIYRVPLVNILGDEGMGYYGVAFQIYAIALTLTSYSLPLAVSKLVSARNATGHYKNAQRVFQSALTFAFLVGGTAALIIFFGADYIATNLMAMRFSAYALRVLAPCILIVAVLGVFRGFFQGNGTMIPTAISQVLEQIINAVVSIAGAYFLIKKATEAGESTEYVMAQGAKGGTLGTIAGAASALVFLFLLFILYRKTMQRQLRRDRRKKTESYTHIFQALVLTIAPVLLSSTVYNLCGVVDNGMFGKIMQMQGHAETDYAGFLGILSGKYDTLINVPLAFSYALGSSLIPSLVTSAKLGDTEGTKEKIALFTRFNMVISIPSAVAFFVLAKPLLDLIFFTEDNTTAARMLQVGALSVIFYCLSTVTNAVHQGLDNMMVPVKSASISLVVHVVTLGIFMIVFHMGIYGVILSKIIFSACASLLNSRALRELVGYRQEIKRTFGIPFLAACVMGVAGYLVHFLVALLISDKLGTLLAILVSVGVYGVSLVLFGGITEGEMKQMPMGTRLAAICRRFRLFDHTIRIFDRI